VPALYLRANAGVAAALLRGRPSECAAGLALLALGLPFYAFFRRGAEDRILQ
jgi:hypothetical protein